MRRTCALGWCLAVFLLLAPEVGGEETPEKSGDAPPSMGDRLFPFGVRSDARPDRASKSDAAPAKALTQGLTWLAAHQHPNGHWTPQDLSWHHGQSLHKKLEGKGKGLYESGVTGLAVSAFLASGYTHVDGSPFAETIRKGLNALSGYQDKEGCVASRVSQHFVYNHAFACLALVEAYVVSGDDRLLPFARRALAFSAWAQNPGSGWRYGVRPGDSDTSATGCLIVAFLAAKLANDAAIAAGREPPLPFRSHVLSGARAWVDRMTDPDYGRTGYIQAGGAPARPMELIETFPGDRSESCTGIGLLIRLFVPRDGDEVANRRAIGLLHAVPPQWNVEGGWVDLYYWYYGCLALERAGDEAFAPWRPEIQKALVHGQRTDGEVATYLGSWDPAGPWGPDGGRIYSTAIAILTLRTAHRFPALPEGRTDLISALRREGRPRGERIRLLEAVAAYASPGARKALDQALESSHAEERAAATRALAACAPNAAGMQRLAQLLKSDPAPVVRVEAARGLAVSRTLMPGTLQALERGTKDADTRVQVATLETLRRLGSKAACAAPTLQPLVKHESPAVRVAAAGALRRTAPDTPGLEATLLEGLRATDATVRWHAALYLAADDAGQPAVHAALTKALEDTSVRVRVEAARGVVQGRYDESVLLTVLGAGLQSKDLDTRVSALQLVTGLGEVVRAAAPLIAPAALDGPPRVRIESVRALGALGAEAPVAVAVLHACQDDPVPAVRELAVSICARLRQTPGPIVSTLLEAMESKDARIAEAAAKGLVACGVHAVDTVQEALPYAVNTLQPRLLGILAEIGEEAKRALPAVCDTIDATSSTAVQRAGARALGALGVADPEAARRLDHLLSAKDGSVRRAAIQALGALAVHQPKAVETLGRLAGTTEKERRPERLEALRSLATAGPAAAPALPAVMQALSDNDEDIRTAAATAIAAIGAAALDPLLVALTSESDVYRRAASQAIAAMGARAKPIAGKLAKGLGAATTWASYDYARALAGGGKAAVRPLKRHLKSKKAVVRAAAAHGLSLLGKEAKSARTTLKRLLKDRDPNVRREAGIALKRIQGSP